MTEAADARLPHTGPHAGPHAAELARAVAGRLDAELGSLADLPQRLQALMAAVPGRIAFSTSLGIEDQAVLHAIAESGVKVDVFTLDTGRLFPETLETLDATERRLGLRVRIVAPESAAVEALVARDGVLGFRRSVEARKACCDVRKVQPLLRALKGAGAWITGIRRAQSPERAGVPFAAYDEAQDLIKVSPIADWSIETLHGYVAAHAIPVNPLHAQGFPSIGCQPCTRAIRPGEDERAGRWWWEDEDGKECGLHGQPKNTHGDNRPGTGAGR